MLHLYLIRHGETIWNTESRMQGRLDSPLTKRGIEQAKKVAWQLRPVALDVIWSSPAPRALKTAEFIMADQAAPRPELRIDGRIHEMDLGDLEGVFVQEAEKADPQNMHAFFYEPQNFRPVGAGESFQQVCERMARFLEDLRKAADLCQRTGKDQHWLVISHNITLKALLALMLGRPLSMLRDGPPILQASLYQVWHDGYWHIRPPAGE